MAATYEPITTTTLSASTNQVDLSGIPSTYTDLVLAIQAKTTVSTAIRLRFNTDTGNNYSTCYFGAYPSTTNADDDESVSNPVIMGQWQNVTTDFANTSIINIWQYKNTNMYKCYYSFDTGATREGTVIAGQWRSTSAITTINIITASQQIDVGTTISLYGIKAA